ncbi:peptidoglycan DD-metalloendopeptidase family protein [Paracoccus kondratievae]|uniref:Peptidase M23 n=1 Tax=Paracoccus kondratievae TaxID=135740 RepID=A0AAD3P0F7_9RHOB|nr:M23 family metallopeptidase [Paracoccus kondratievae]QFQ88760.1 peptidoglycan DD-metalloendopeptidase family protein [Paracoccus kondratievae]GLK65214.1 peptidase M23 [Paracoccus kondratievae]
MTEVDPRFRQMGRGARRRRRRVNVLRMGVVAAALGGLGLWCWPWLISVLSPAPQMVQVESQFEIAPVVRGDTFTDIIGDPIIIPPPESGAEAEARQVPAPAALAATGRVTGRAARLALLDSALVPRDRQLVAALPSTREEFALFQAERSRERLTNASFAQPQAAAGDPASDIVFLRDGTLRSPLWRELILETARDTTAEALLAENGFDAAEAARLARRMQAQLGQGDALAAGTVLAMRWRPRHGGREVIQLSLYGPGGYLGSLALSAAGQLVPGADPWVDQPLMRNAMAKAEDAAPQGQRRLLDVIYSAALRNDVPPELIGEALALMAQVYDLDSYADPEDRLSLIYAEGAADRAGSVLFVGVSGKSGDKACYVVPADEGFECYAPGARLRRLDSAGLLQPVGGVLSQRFVPPAAGGNDDPGRGQVVWTAPQDSPVLAAAAGRVTALDGDRVEITHPGGLVSRYAGLVSVAQELSRGAEVARGAPVGQVGVPPGRSEPGLAFQLLRDGVPIDPLPMLGGGAEVLASDSIESLIGHIIRVESGGDAGAKNPRSTATGLGQFIESTWLRMMHSYRPDLVGSLSRRELLDLRLDAGLSRQMVRHLAQENEAFLRARGHSISAGRLYLAHFLGPAGADQALRADPAQSVEAVMGQAVVVANPFLRGWSVADLRNWADRKMSGPAGGVVGTIIPERPLTPELRAYVDEMDRLRRKEQG